MERWRRFPAVFLLFITVSMVMQSAYVLAANPWVQPAEPKQGDTVTIYYYNPNATDVRFSVCSESGDVCYIVSDTGRTDNGTWWATVENMPAGYAHYTIEGEITIDNRTTSLEIDRYFMVEAPDEAPGFPVLTVGVIAAAIILAALTIWVWRMKRERD